MTKIKQLGYVCTLDYAFQRVGGKYKGRIIWHLSMEQVMRYGELRKTLWDITPKMLTQTLREMESDGLIHREVYHEVPPKVEYSLKETGRQLIPFIDYLREWGAAQMAKDGLI